MRAETTRPRVLGWIDPSIQRRSAPRRTDVASTEQQPCNPSSQLIQSNTWPQIQTNNPSLSDDKLSLGVFIIWTSRIHNYLQKSFQRSSQQTKYRIASGYLRDGRTPVQLVRVRSKPSQLVNQPNRSTAAPEKSSFVMTGLPVLLG